MALTLEARLLNNLGQPKQFLNLLKTSKDVNNQSIEYQEVFNMLLINNQTKAATDTQIINYLTDKVNINDKKLSNILVTNPKFINIPLLTNLIIKKYTNNKIPRQLIDLLNKIIPKYKNNEQLIRFLITKSEFDPSVNNNQFIRIASYDGYSEIVKELLKDSRIKITQQSTLRLALKAWLK